MTDQSDAIAIEHVIYAAGQGMSPRDVLTSIGIGWTPAEPSWDDARLGLSLAWRRLRSTNSRPSLRLVKA